MSKQQRPTTTNKKNISSVSIVDPPKVKNIVCEADHQTLRESYSFLPPTTSSSTSLSLSQPQPQPQQNKEQSNLPIFTSTWQDRMVQSYHDHLYKEYALADLSRGPGQQIGLRWRTKQEVIDGRGERTCGNKHCSSLPARQNNNNNNNINNNDSMPLMTLEVPFSYQERGVQKMELVKLRLCPVCVPLVKSTRGNSTTTNSQTVVQSESAPSQDSSAEEQSDVTTSSSSSSSSNRRRRRQKKRRIRTEECRRRKKQR
jgi:protein FRA10AC1